MKEITGIVIRNTQFRDSDAMVTVLSNEKIYSFLARGVLKIKSKNASSVNLYNKSKFTLTKNKDGFSLRTGEVINSYKTSRKNLETLSVLDFLGEVTNKLIISEDAEQAYLWLDALLDALDDGHDPLTIALIYLCNVLKINGSGINVNECVICHKKEAIVGLNFSLGGFICRNCASSGNEPKIDPEKLKMIRFLFKVDISHITYAIVGFKYGQEFLKELGEYVNNQFDVTLKSIQILDKTLK